MVSFFDGPRPRLFGHRGAAGEAPENTIESFRLALEQGADIIETDVRGSREGEIVVIHDASVDRTTDGSGAVVDLELARVRELDAGFRFSRDGGKTYPFRGTGLRIPTLAEVIEELPGIPLNIEIKQESPSIVERVVELARSAARPLVLASANDSIMRRVRELAPDIPTSFSAREIVDFVRAVLAGAEPPVPHGARALQIPPDYGGIMLVTEQLVEAAHRVGVEIHVWTINDTGEMGRLLDLGVDGIMTDFPGRARSVIAAR